ncbi:MAG: hypothetical protein S0880_04685 [Actinomycetota bacterium]|nr:hypothetical protein [Actinomycetota bacterium]
MPDDTGHGRDAAGVPAGLGGAGTCESCARDGEAVWSVRRVYVTQAAWDTEGRRDTAAAVELWCGACLANYPHEPVEPGPGGPGVTPPG